MFLTVELVAVVVLVVFFDADGVTVLLIVKLVVAASIVVEGTVVGTTLVKGSMPFVERFKPPKAIKFKRPELMSRLASNKTESTVYKVLPVALSTLE